jgi:molecular chaperone GrpE
VDADEVEILEVVGIDDDIPAPSAAPPEQDAADSEDIVLTLDADAEPELESAADPEPQAAAASEGLAGDPSLVETELVQRLRADYDNLRKRIGRERQAYEEQANSNLIEVLLPVLDNFDRALSAEIRSGTDGAFRAGMVMIHEQFSEALKKEGLRRIESVGQPFDPNLHDAVATDGESTAPANTIIEELQRGYLFQDRVLRPAMVRVSTNGSGGALLPRDDEDR